MGSLTGRKCTVFQAMVVLRQQYRMAAAVMALANELVYGGQLRCGSDAVAEATLQLPRSCDAGLPSWLQEVSCESCLAESIASAERSKCY